MAPPAAPALPDGAWRAAGLIVAAALAVALAAMTFGPHRVGDYFTETDFYGAYADGARLLQTGHVDPSRYGVVGPGYEVALALAGFVVRDLFRAAGLLSLVAAVATVLAWRRVLDQRVSAAAGCGVALLLAVNGTLFRYGYAVTTDALAIALMSGCVACLLTTTGARGAAAAGLLAAGAFLTRYNLLVLLPLGLLAVALGGTPHRPRGRALAAFAGAFLAPVVPWVAYSLARGQHLELRLYHNIAYEVYARARGIAWDTYQSTMESQFHSLGDVIARDPGAVAARMAFNLVDHLRQDAGALLGLPVALAALAGLALGVRDGTWRRLWAIPLGAALLFLTLVPVFYSERYSLAVLPFWLSFAACAFAALRPPRAPWVGAAALAAVAAWSLSSSVRLQARTLDQLPLETLSVARTLRQIGHPGEGVIARKGHVAFHAGMRAVPFPFADSLPQLANAARRAHARWLYISWPEVETRPKFWALLDTSAHVPGLSVRAVTRPHPAVLYEIGPGFGTAPAWAADDSLRALHVARARVLVNPHDAQALAALGDLAPAAGAVAEGRAALDTLLSLRPDNVDAWLARGHVALLERDAPGAAAAFGRAEQIDPTSAEARIGRGWAALLAGHREEAAELWRPVAGVARERTTLEAMVTLYHERHEPEAEAQARAQLAREGRAP